MKPLAGDRPRRTVVRSEIRRRESLLSRNTIYDPRYRVRRRSIEIDPNTRERRFQAGTALVLVEFYRSDSSRGRTVTVSYDGTRDDRGLECRVHSIEPRPITVGRSMTMAELRARTIIDHRPLSRIWFGRRRRSRERSAVSTNGLRPKLRRPVPATVERRSYGFTRGGRPFGRSSVDSGSNRTGAVPIEDRTRGCVPRTRYPTERPSRLSASYPGEAGDVRLSSPCAIRLATDADSQSVGTVTEFIHGFTRSITRFELANSSTESH